MKEYLLGIDIGTSGVKAIVMDKKGVIEAIASKSYGTSIPKPLWSEQDPEDWWKATIESLNELTNKTKGKGTIIGIGITGQMHGLVLLNRSGEVLRPCILWNDQRTFKECEEIYNIVGKEEILRITGNRVLPGFTAPKIIWVKKNEPEIYSKIAKILLPKDYIRYKLTGEFYSDVSDASGTSLFNVGKRNWAEEVIKALQIKREWLPDVTESPQVCGYISKEAGELTGLKEGTPVVAGAGDQASQAIGTGIIKEGIISVTIGTSGVVFACLDNYIYDREGRLHAFCHAVPEKWHLMGVMLSAGGSLQWFINAFGREGYSVKDNIGSLMEKAKQVRPMSDGLVFLPYLTGERTPYPDPYASGVFFGINPSHKRAHFFRAVLEGVGFGLKDSLELIESLGIEPLEIRISGGGAKSELWQQILANIFNYPIYKVNTTEGACYGAGLLAGVGTGVFRDVNDAVEKIIKSDLAYVPDKDSEIYKKFHKIYRKLYFNLKEIFREHTELKLED